MRRMAMILAAVVVAAHAYAQKYPERRFIRSGNAQYERENYVEAEISYRRAQEKEQNSYEAAANLGKSLYKQERWDEAAQIFAPLAADTTYKAHRAHAFYDQGNALFKQRKFREAVEAYKESLRIAPDDMECKFNLAYALKMLQDEEGGGDKDNDQNQQPEPQPSEASPQPAEAREGQLSENEAERMLEAVQMSEDKTREKMDEKKGKPGKVRGGKNW